MVPFSQERLPAWEPRPADAIALSGAHSAMVYLRSIGFDIGHRLVKRRRRHRAQVNADYDSGEWGQQRAARRWSEVSDLEAYVDRTWVKGRIVATIGNRLWDIPARDYYRVRRARIAAVLARHAGDAETLVELGSGTGTNLFGLALEPRWRQLIGLEMSPVGLEVTGTVARHFGVESKVQCGPIDLLDLASPGFAQLAGSTVFTNFCLEQLPYATDTVFENLIAAGIRRAVMIEPSFELLRPTSLRDLASITYVLRQDYQRSLLRVARSLESAGRIRIIELKRLDFAPLWRNTPTLLVWEPIV